MKKGCFGIMVVRFFRVNLFIETELLQRTHTHEPKTKNMRTLRKWR